MKRNLRAEAFLNALRITHNMSGLDVSEICVDHGHPFDSVAFAKDPFMWLMKAPLPISQAIYERVIDPQQPERLRDKVAHVYFGCDYGNGEITMKALAVAVSDADGRPVMWRIEDMVHETPNT